MSRNQAPTPQKTLRMPPTLGLIAILLLLAAIAAQILPPGEFDRQERTFKTSGVKYLRYKVQAGDTLESIAKKKGDETTTPDQILVAETAEPVEALTPGMVVKVPVVKTMKRTVVIPGSYTRAERKKHDTFLSLIGDVLGQVFVAPIRGFVYRAQIIAFILLIGGAFGMILATGAIDAALRITVDKLGQQGLGWVVIPVSMVLFSLAGALFGMSEEVIPFVMITVPLALRLGYDSITGLCLSFLAADLGFAGAMLNPFTIGIAQGIAEIPIFSGIGFRMVIWVILTGMGIVYTMIWAARVRKNPQLSPTFEHDKKLIHRFEAADGELHRFHIREALVVLAVFGAAAGSAWGVTHWGWYINELAGLFLAAGVLSAIFGRLALSHAVSSFVKGASDLVGASMVVAFSAGIVIIAQDGLILDTILNYIAASLEGTHTIIGASLMFFFQTLLNFFVPSGSGQAAMTMPIIAPLSDLMGITRQVGVLAFQFGDGFSNMIIPTSAVTMGCLGVAEVPWEKWAKWILPLQLILVAFGIAALAVAVLIGYS